MVKTISIALVLVACGGKMSATDDVDDAGIALADAQSPIGHLPGCVPNPTSYDPTIDYELGSQVLVDQHVYSCSLDVCGESPPDPSWTLADFCRHRLGAR